MRYLKIHLAHAARKPQFVIFSPPAAVGAKFRLDWFGFLPGDWGSWGHKMFMGPGLLLIRNNAPGGDGAAS